MGTIIKAKCECGFDSGEIFEGGGFFNYKTTDMEPAICPNCRKFLVRNYLEKHIKCPNCGTEIVFYNDPSVQERTLESKQTKSRPIQWGDFKLPDTGYLCPKCGKMTLRFVQVGLWD